jgi:hypothetical protein
MATVHCGSFRVTSGLGSVDLVSMADRVDEKPEDWADRASRGDDPPAPVTSGARFGMTGPGALRGWLVVLALLSLVVFVNVTTELDDAHRRGVAMRLAWPLTLELTSAFVSCFAVTLILALVRFAPPTRRPYWRTALIHLGGSVAYSIVHVGLMTALRLLVFPLLAMRYTWSPAELPYEYRKDLLSYVVVATIFWLLDRRTAPATAGEPTPVPADPATFDIRDGASLLRVPVAEILAAKAAGNYVEFALADGRQPLMRASMAQVETALAPRGFVRTHRSWLVNPARVRALSPAGSGDFRIDLGDGLIAPASRRYPEALARLRGQS